MNTLANHVRQSIADVRAWVRRRWKGEDAHTEILVFKPNPAKELAKSLKAVDGQISEESLKKAVVTAIDSRGVHAFRYVLGGEDMRVWYTGHILGSNAVATGDATLYQEWLNEERAAMKVAEGRTLHALGRLIEAGYDINAKDEYGDTALHGYLHSFSRWGQRAEHEPFRSEHREWLSQCGARIIRWLVGHGASANIVNNDGKTPLDYAIPEHKACLMNALIEHERTVLSEVAADASPSAVRRRRM